MGLACAQPTEGVNGAYLRDVVNLHKRELRFASAMVEGENVCIQTVLRRLEVKQVMEYCVVFNNVRHF